MIWCCPSCYRELLPRVERWECADCGEQYPLIAGIPDLRVSVPSWIDVDADRERAVAAEVRIGADGLEAAITGIFLNSRKFSQEKAEYRAKQVLGGVKRLEQELDGWLAAALADEPVVELGCGPGQLLAAAAKHNRCVAGVDVCVEWLVIAKHLVKKAGGEPLLAAGLAERLPIRSQAVSALISLDVIEHVGDRRAFVSEIMRVLKRGGRFALSTPNRFSLSPEPHVGVWGVGFLPVGLQAAWVRAASGKSYEFTQLLSVFEAKKLFAGASASAVEIDFPPIPEAEIGLYSKFRARLARLYNAIIKSRIAKLAAPFFGAYFRIIGVKS
jgi:SAM-dependent methyltransferase